MTSWGQCDSFKHMLKVALRRLNERFPGWNHYNVIKMTGGETESCGAHWTNHSVSVPFLLFLLHHIDRFILNNGSFVMSIKWLLCKNQDAIVQHECNHTVLLLILLILRGLWLCEMTNGDFWGLEAGGSPARFPVGSLFTRSALNTLAIQVNVAANAKPPPT